MAEIHSSSLVRFFLQVSVMLTVALIFGQLVRRLRQPTVLGELIGGILLGPTGFGTLAPSLYAWLFPSDAGVLQEVRDTLIQMGMLFFLFVAGLEINLTHLQQHRKKVLVTSLFGCLWPFCLGVGSVFLYRSLWNLSPQAPVWIFALFIGTALSISALPVITRILMDLHLLRHHLGIIILSAATFSDLIGWMLFAVLLNSLEIHRPGWPLGYTLLGITAALGFILLVGRGIGRPVLHWVQHSLLWPSGFIGVIIVLILTAAAFTEMVGIHAIFGAFLVGVALHPVFESQEGHPAREIIHQFALSFFAPLYFVSIGLKVDFTAHFDLPLVLFVIGVATVGKVGGASLGAWLSRMSGRDALAVGFGLNARGAMEIILASVALEVGLIDPRVFVALVIMALVTSLLSGPVLHGLVKSPHVQPVEHG